MVLLLVGIVLSVRLGERPSARYSPAVERGRTKVARRRETRRLPTTGEGPAAASLSRIPHGSTPPHVHGKEGVDGSSRSEGSAKSLHTRSFPVGSPCRWSSMRWIWSRFWGFPDPRSAATTSGYSSCSMFGCGLLSADGCATRSGAALNRQDREQGGSPAVSVRDIAGAPVALVDHARAERPGLDQHDKPALSAYDDLSAEGKADVLAFETLTSTR